MKFPHEILNRVRGRMVTAVSLVVSSLVPQRPGALPSAQSSPRQLASVGASVVDPGSAIG